MPDRDELSRTLLDLRHEAGLSGVTAAKLAGISQASISRYERGKFVPGPDDVDTLARIYGASAEVRLRLRGLARDLREDIQVPARLVMLRGAEKMQQRIGRVEQASVHVRHFHPLVITGLLQTPDYARAVFASGLPPEQIEPALAARLDRQQLVREPEGREFTFVLAEGALRWRLIAPDAMADQLDHLVELSRFPHIRLGVIPWTTQVSVTPMHGFDVYDRRAVIFGTTTATAFLTNPNDVAAYVAMFDSLEATAIFEDQARSLVAATAVEFRALSDS